LTVSKPGRGQFLRRVAEKFVHRIFHKTLKNCGEAVNCYTEGFCAETRLPFFLRLSVRRFIRNFAKNRPGSPVAACFNYITMLPLIILK
jgi:hypothetical protein